MTKLEFAMLALAVVQGARFILEVYAHVRATKVRNAGLEVQARYVGMMQKLMGEGPRVVSMSVPTVDMRYERAVADAQADIMDGRFTIEPCNDSGILHWHVIDPDGDRVGGAYSTESAAIEVANMLNAQQETPRH